MTILAMDQPEPCFDPSKINFSFAGCGFLGIYHVGAAWCIREYVPHLVRDNICSGASAGAIAAVLLACDGSLEEITQSLIDCARVSNSRPAGPFSPSVDIHSKLRKDLDRILPQDAHIRANGKLRISLTKIPKTKWFGIGIPNPLQRKNIIISHFDSREEVLDAVMCATFIPGFSGICLPKFRGDTVMDGGLTDNCPGLDSWTIRVNPYAGDAHISPKETEWSPIKSPINISNTSFQLTVGNISRLKNTFMPSDPGELQNSCNQGFSDTYAFLKSRGWIPNPPENPQYLPQNIQDIFEKDGEDFKSGPISLRKIYSYTSARILNALNLPLLVAFEGVVLAGSKVVQQPLLQEALTPFYTIQPNIPRNYERSPTARMNLRLHLIQFQF